MAKLKLIETIQTKLSTLTKSDGQLIVVRDNASLYIDLDGNRVYISDWIDVETDTDRLAMLSPLSNKYYYVVENNKVWRYKNGSWVLVSSINDLNEYWEYVKPKVLQKSGDSMEIDAEISFPTSMDDRNLKIGNGRVSFIASTSNGYEGWGMGQVYKTHDESSSLGSIGAYGVGDTIKYYYMGAYNNPLLKVTTDGTVSAKNFADENGNTIKETYVNKTDIIPLNKGGTGATTAKAAEYAILGTMPESTAAITDNAIVVFRKTSPNTTDGVTVYKKMLLFWDYIQGKISSILGLTATNYNGTSAKATADASGNNISTTYATKTELAAQIGDVGSVLDAINRKVV